MAGPGCGPARRRIRRPRLAPASACASYPGKQVGLACPAGAATSGHAARSPQGSRPRSAGHRPAGTRSSRATLPSQAMRSAPCEPSPGGARGRSLIEEPGVHPVGVPLDGHRARVDVRQQQGCDPLVVVDHLRLSESGRRVQHLAQVGQRQRAALDLYGDLARIRTALIRTHARPPPPPCRCAGP